MLGQNLVPSLHLGNEQEEREMEETEKERAWFLSRENFMMTVKFFKMRFDCVILIMTT